MVNCGTEEILLFICKGELHVSKTVSQVCLVYLVCEKNAIEMYYKVDLSIPLKLDVYIYCLLEDNLAS